MVIAFQTLVVLTVGSGMGALCWAARRSSLMPTASPAAPTALVEPRPPSAWFDSAPCELDLPATMPGRIERFVV